MESLLEVLGKASIFGDEMGVADQVAAGELRADPEPPHELWVTDYLAGREVERCLYATCSCCPTLDHLRGRCPLTSVVAHNRCSQQRWPGRSTDRFWRPEQVAVERFSILGPHRLRGSLRCDVACPGRGVERLT